MGLGLGLSCCGCPFQSQWKVYIHLDPDAAARHSVRVIIDWLGDAIPENSFGFNHPGPRPTEVCFPPEGPIAAGGSPEIGWTLLADCESTVSEGDEWVWERSSPYRVVVRTSAPTLNEPIPPTLTFNQTGTPELPHKFCAPPTIIEGSEAITRFTDHVGIAEIRSITLGDDSDLTIIPKPITDDTKIRQWLILGLFNLPAGCFHERLNAAANRADCCPIQLTVQSIYDIESANRIRLDKDVSYTDPTEVDSIFPPMVRLDETYDIPWAQIESMLSA